MVRCLVVEPTLCIACIVCNLSIKWLVDVSHLKRRIILIDLKVIKSCHSSEMLDEVSVVVL